ncbi:MAG: tyrosine-type recombinase/integrase [Desulfobacterales bacterium]|nr:tyrosine-type recombinase/integrase [Desulfobacterales bacterium]
MKGCRTLTNEEIKRIINNAEIRDRALFLTGLTFGTRISESLELKFKDVSGAFLYLKSKKGSDNQAFPIPDSYRVVIERLKKEYESKGINVNFDTYLFISRKGDCKSITRQQASQVIKQICNELDINGKINSHSFRKSFITKIYELTKFNIVETQTYSRHKSISNLEYYISTTEKTDLVNKLVWC